MNLVCEIPESCYLEMCDEPVIGCVLVGNGDNNIGKPVWFCRRDLHDFVGFIEQRASAGESVAYTIVATRDGEIRVLDE